MAENSKIEWTHHTFNPWIGCAKVSPGCKHCYAETLMDTRYGRVEWGVNGTRMRTSDNYWKQPLKWDKEAAKNDVRYRVFCASLADVFEDRPELRQWREDLFMLIARTRNLDWLLLTKRPENIRALWPDMPFEATDEQLRFENVWLGTSVENQAAADERIPQLLGCAGLCKFTFLSCEPLIGRTSLYYGIVNGIDWVIVGGESGQGSRPMPIDWARELRDECEQGGIPFLFKQWGEYDEHGRRVGKHASGRLLDGVEYNGYPSTQVA